jgi:hypothetical protein
MLKQLELQVQLELAQQVQVFEQQEQQVQLELVGELVQLELQVRLLNYRRPLQSQLALLQLAQSDQR